MEAYIFTTDDKWTQEHIDAEEPEAFCARKVAFWISYILEKKTPSCVSLKAIEDEIQEWVLLNDIYFVNLDIKVVLQDIQCLLFSFFEYDDIIFTSSGITRGIRTGSLTLH
jgi:hypothetical protein